MYMTLLLGANPQRGGTSLPNGFSACTAVLPDYALNQTNPNLETLDFP